MEFRPIGRVRGEELRLHRRWSRALDGIQGFSHLLVVTWLSEARRPELKLHPKGDKRIPKLGCLATRTPHRPNPIGVTVVRLVRRRGSVLLVEGLDVWDGTPVLDLKPYTKRDAIRRFRMPGWVRLLDKAEKDPLRRYASRAPRPYRARRKEVVGGR